MIVDYTTNYIHTYTVKESYIYMQSEAETKIVSFQQRVLWTKEHDFLEITLGRNSVSAIL